MSLNIEEIIMIIAALVTLGLLIFAVDWRYFRDWVVVFLFKTSLDLALGSIVVEEGLVEYPVRLLKNHFDSEILFEMLVFPTLCVLYNQITRNRGPWPIFYYAVLFSAGITAVEYPLELYTDLIRYIEWSWFTTLYSITGTFLISRVFIAFYRWGCNHFGR